MKVEFRALHGPSDWGWINLQVPLHRVDDTNGVIAVNLDTNETIGALVTDNWTSNSVQCHFMLTDVMVLKYGFIQECMDFIFHHAGRQIAYGLVPGNNEKALTLNARMGFSEKCRLVDAFAPGIDYVVMELKKDDAVFLPDIPQVGLRDADISAAEDAETVEETDDG